MKGDATTHTTNAKYREGWERVFGNKRKWEWDTVWGYCVGCNGPLNVEAANNMYCSSCLAKP
jgi:hypothetical protein